MKEPWIKHLKIIKVVDPIMMARPFVEVWNNKARPHTFCVFSEMASSCYSESDNSSEEKVEISSKIPGLSDHDEIMMIARQARMLKNSRKSRKAGS